MPGRWLSGLWREPAARGDSVVAAQALDTATLWYPLHAAERCPLVLYLPGWNGRRNDNAVLAAELASQGFAVAAMDDPRPGGAMDFRTEAARAATLRRIDVRLAASVTAVRGLLDRLAGSECRALSGRLDTARVGIVGFSFGGAAAAEASLQEPRLAGVVNMDGWLFGRAADAGIACPYLLLSDDTPAPGAAQLTSPSPAIRIRAMLDAADLRQQAVQFATHGGWRVTLRGAVHDSFTDARLHAKLRRLRGLDPMIAQHIIGACCVAFFRHVLLRQGPALPDLALLPAARLDAAPCRSGPPARPAAAGPAGIFCRA